MSASSIQQVVELLAADDEGRVCKDIPESACHHQPRNVLLHMASLTSTKAADGLLDAKLILSWLLTHLGAPVFFIGLLVPVREAGALLPQLFTAASIRALPQRKWAWAAGSLVQGLCTVGIALAAIFLQGKTAGVVIISLLTVLSIARSVCSVSYKDVLGKTVSKSKRGSTTGAATSLSAGITIVFALLLTLNIFDRNHLVIAGLCLAGGLWMLGAALFTRLVEERGATSGGGNASQVVKEHYKDLTEDKQLQLFILTRGLLIATALAPPFMVTLTDGGDQPRFGELGLLVLASAAASLLSSYVWGRLADRSSRKVLVFSALAASLALCLTIVAEIGGVIGQLGVLPLLLFTLMIAYQGVRLGRATHLVDMASKDKRATYTALSNTIIGVLLLGGGLFSVVAQYAGELPVIALLALMSFLAIFSALKLEEVQQEG